MILIERPPNFELILKAFPDASGPGVIFAYGEHIYNPSGNPIPGPLVAHEKVHQERQRGVYGNPDEWWFKYINEPQFRYHEEMFAHVAEYRTQLPGLDRNDRAKLLQSTARRLIAPLYNYQPPRTLPQAMCDLRQELEQ